MSDLRPYQGSPLSQHFGELVAAVDALAPSLASSEWIDWDLACELWTLSALARCWGVHPDGLARLDSITADSNLLSFVRGLERFELAVARALGVMSPSPVPETAWVPRGWGERYPERVARMHEEDGLAGVGSTDVSSEIRAHSNRAGGGLMAHLSNGEVRSPDFVRVARLIVTLGSSCPAAVDRDAMAATWELLRRARLLAGTWPWDESHSRPDLLLCDVEWTAAGTFP